jgi:hypothetical protein
MSGGDACACAERLKPPAERRWVVLDRCCNYSAFSGYARTRSAYSSVSCQVCGRIWRTRAKYVRSLPDGTWKQEQED